MPAIGDKVPDTPVMITTAVLIGVPAMGMATDASSFGLGTRSERYAAIIRDGVITSLDVETTFVQHEVSSVEAVLAKL